MILLGQDSKVQVVHYSNSGASVPVVNVCLQSVIYIAKLLPLVYSYINSCESSIFLFRPRHNMVTWWRIMKLDIKYYLLGIVYLTDPVHMG